MALNTAFRLKTIVDTIPGTSNSLGSAPQEELHFTERERWSVRTEKLPTDFVEKRLPEGRNVRNALDRISRTHHMSLDPELFVSVSEGAEGRWTLSCGECHASTAILEAWYEKATPLDTSTESSVSQFPVARNLSLEHIDVSSDLLQAVRRLWDQRFLPTQVDAALYKVTVFGGRGMVRGGIDSPPGAVGLLQVAIGHERSLMISHAYRSQGLMNAFREDGLWGASAVPCSISMATG